MNQNRSSAFNLESAMSLMIGYFKTSLSHEAKQQYVVQIGYIPREAMDDIASKIMAERRPSSGNFPTIQEIRNYWFLWQRENPQKVVNTRKQIIPCESCNGTGLLRFKGPIPHNEGRPYYDKPMQLICWCGNCENWKRHVNNIDGDRRYTKQEIIDKGWKLWPYDRSNEKRSIPNMIDDIGESIKPVFEDYSDPKWNDRRIELQNQAQQLQDEIPF